MSTIREQLKEELIRSNLISQENLEKAVQLQKEKGGKLQDIIIELKFVGEKDLALVLSKIFGNPLIELKRFKIDPEVLKLVSRETTLQYQIIPLSKIGNTITLAMADPLNILVLDDLNILTGYKINPVIAQTQEIISTINQCYEDNTDKMIEDIVKNMSEITSFELLDEKKEDLPPMEELSRLTKEEPVIKITNMLLDSAVKKHASDILIEPWDKSLHIRFRIDGILQEQDVFPKTMHPSIVSRIKVISELDIAEHRLPQDGRFKAKMEDREVDFRVSILPSSFGEKVALRILDKITAMLDVEKLGFGRENLDAIKKCATHPHGMLLACGPTGSGKTTTLYSILKYVDTPEKNIVTVEDPVEYQLDGINQVTARTDIGLTFASALRSILRQDPDVIMVGEIRDFDTVDIAIKAALTGHLVLSTLHTTTAPGSLVRLTNMGVEPFLITSSVVCIVAQRLVRKICEHCKESYVLGDDMAKKTGLGNRDKEVVFFKGAGCKYCFKTGYSGRVGIVEVLVLTPAVKELILVRAEEYKIKALARKEGMKTLREEGVEKALAGITTLEEVLRVTAPDEEGHQAIA